MSSMFDVVDDYLGGEYGLLAIICLIAFIIAYILIFHVAKKEDFGVMLIFSGIFVMIANAIGIDKTKLTFFIGVFEVVLGIYLSVKRSG